MRFLKFYLFFGSLLFLNSLILWTPSILKLPIKYFILNIKSHQDREQYKSRLFSNSFLSNMLNVIHHRIMVKNKCIPVNMVDSCIYHEICENTIIAGRVHAFFKILSFFLEFYLLLNSLILWILFILKAPIKYY